MNGEIGNAVYLSLVGAATIIEAFQKAYNREPSDAELRVAATLFIEENKQRRTDQISKERATRRAPARPKQAAPAEGVPSCPKCGGAMFDNRKGKKNPKAPDFRCKDEGCTDPETGYRTALWESDLEREGEPVPAGPHPNEPSSEAATFKPEDALPF